MNFKYKLKNNPIQEASFNHIDDYLRRLGIVQTSSFLGQTLKNDEIDPFKLDNMRRGVIMLKKHIDAGSKIFLVVDSDADGFTSATIIYNFIKKVYPDADIVVYIHPGKEHGVVMKNVPFDVDLIIVPDAGSNQKKEQEECVAKGIDFLCIDHHLIDEYFEHENIVIINNQDSNNFSNKYLSGAGMAYKFIQAYDMKYLQQDAYKHYVDLAALGILSDMMNITSLDNNYIIKEGLRKINNEQIKAILRKQSYSVSSVVSPTITDLVFYVTPIINGVIRVGTLDEKEELFSGLTTEGSTRIITRQWRGETKRELFYDSIARKSMNVRARQNRTVQKVMENICKHIEENNLQDNQIILYKTSKTDAKEIPKPITGLVAMRIMQKYNRPTMILRPVKKSDGLYYAGSIRGFKVGGFRSFKDFLDNSGFVTYAAGHDMAAGTEIKADKISDFLVYAEDALEHVDFGTDEIEVDYIFNNRNIDKNMLMSFASHEHIYGNGIPTPKFAFELVVPKRDIGALGSKGETTKIVCGGLSMLRFKDSEFVKQATDIQSPTVKVTAVGKATINEWNGRKSVQIIMEHVYLEEINAKSLI